MLKKEDRIRTEFVPYKGGKQIQYVHLCKDCGVETWKTSSEEKTSKGYCLKCSYNHRSLKSGTYNDNGEKWCSYCKRFLPTDKFLKKGQNKRGLSTACSKCHNLKQFGINSVDYELLLKQQKNLCAICYNPELANDKGKDYKRALAVDHCHQSNKVRGLLCTNCNIMLGQSKDDIETLKNAIAYLKKHGISEPGS